MTNRIYHLGGPVLCLLLALALWPAVARGQKVLGAKGFTSADYYPEPHETQMKTLLKGAQFQPLGGGLTSVTNAELQTFRTNGQIELVVRAPQCFYEESGRSVSSAGPVHAQTADGRYSIEGEGFLWQQANSSFIISNRVHTVIEPAPPDPSASATHPGSPDLDTSPVDVYANRFEYAAESQQGVYRGNARVVGTNMTLRSQILTVNLPKGDARTPSGLQSLQADQEVILDYGAVRAQGDRAIYAPETGLIRMSGHPTWRAEHRYGGGDELILDRTNKLFHALGQAWLRMPGQSLSASGPLNRRNSQPANSAPATNQFVEVRSDSYEFGTNWAVFRQQVRVTDLRGEEVQGKMSCGLMTVSFTGTNEFRRMVAENQVVIERADKRFTGGRGVYTATNGWLELTDHPTWRAGLRDGRGERLRVNLEREEMLVRGNAYMRLPASELGQSVAPPGAADPARSQPKGGTNQFGEIFCEEYTLQQTNAVFRGGVYASHPQMNCVCEQLTVGLASTAPDTKMVVAEKGVVFDLMDEKGRKVHGKGDKAVYTFGITKTETNDVVRLTGTPAILEMTNATVQNDLIILDRAKDKLTADGGKYVMHGTTSVADTNMFQVPKMK